MDKLTPREREVVTLMAQGKRAPDIAAALCITPGTVQTHVNNARCKSGARTPFEFGIKVARELSDSGV